MRQPITPEERAAIMAWRREQRQRLIALRLAMPVAYRQEASARIIVLLAPVVGFDAQCCPLARSRPAFSRRSSDGAYTRRIYQCNRGMS
nr:H484 [uncultured bacterium]